VEAFCQKQGWNPVTLMNWVRRLRQSSAVEATPPGFVRLTHRRSKVSGKPGAAGFEVVRAELGFALFDAELATAELEERQSRSLRVSDGHALRDVGVDGGKSVAAGESQRAFVVDAFSAPAIDDEKCRLAGLPR